MQNDTFALNAGPETGHLSLRAGEGLFRQVVERAPNAMVIVDQFGQIEMVNIETQRLFGYGLAELLHHPVEMLIPVRYRGNHAGLRSSFFTAPLARPMGNGRELFALRNDGSEFPVEIGLSPIQTDAGTMTLSIIVDITERKRLEGQLRQALDALHQAQKMESLGLLTGGIAHDFNNALTIIIGNIDTVQRSGEVVSPRLQRALDYAARGSARAVKLTSRLLAFARQQILDPKPVDLNVLVGRMHGMLANSLGETISVRLELAKESRLVSIDASQLEDALLNIALNARDAMAGGGTLTIETAEIHLDASMLKNESVQPGSYSFIAVRDTGHGMAKEVRDRVFEPFFTTKEVGKGTGLGLAQVYGFVRQSGGFVEIESSPGCGTVFRLLFPTIPAQRVPDGIPLPVGLVGLATRGEAIMVVEYDAEVRAHSVGILHELGYRVVEASDGRAALLAMDAEPAIDLLFTDIELRGGMTGWQLAREAKRRHPSLQVLFTSSSARAVVPDPARGNQDADLLAKPFAYAGLGRKVREILDRPDAAMTT